MIRLLRMGLLRVLLGLGVLAVLLGGTGYWLYREGLQRPLALPSAEFHYTLRPGVTLRQTAADLAAQGVMNYPVALTWLVWARWQQRAHQIRAGEYAIAPGTNPRQLLELFISGKTVQYSLVIPEGWTFQQMRTALAAHPKLRHTLDGLSDAQLMARLGQPTQHPEGRFFPDTYQFDADTADWVVLQRAYQKMAEELAAAWATRAAEIPLSSPDEALILASIVEKETGAPEERPQIAGVFSRRLQQGMRLQTDPTVIYGLGAVFDGNLRKLDLQQDTPYNSYTRTGLPPTPIALPGRAALRAAVAPAAGDALYFVASGEGRHHFSATLSEHDCAVIAYQLKGKAPAQYQRRCRERPDCAACRS